MIDTEIVQRCGCGEDDCVEILGLEESIYACFTCGYAGVTPSGADNHEDEIHIGNLEAEVKRLRKAVEGLVISMRLNTNLENEDFMKLMYKLEIFERDDEE
tara:strand:- start:1242 stop:1544 length:303 start_codon:yes stop_codon:yes gene_type:complete